MIKQFCYCRTKKEKGNYDSRHLSELFFFYFKWHSTVPVEIRLHSATHCPDTLTQTCLWGFTTTDQQNRQTNGRGGTRKCHLQVISCHMKDISISVTTQSLSPDPTKRSWSKACCSEANGCITKSQLEIKVEKKKTTTATKLNKTKQKKHIPQSEYTNYTQRAVTNADTSHSG